MPSCFLWLEIEILAISLNEKTGAPSFAICLRSWQLLRLS